MANIIEVERFKAVFKHSVCIWEEDDSCSTDRETLYEAFKRIFPNMECKKGVDLTLDDTVVTFYPQGRILIMKVWSCGLGAIHVANGMS